MNFAFIKKNYHITTFILLYLSLLFGFYNNETTTFGPKIDFEHALKQVQLFDKNFIYTFLNYDKIEYQNWWRGTDLNRRPSGYEPDELPDCSTPRYS